MEPIRDKWGTKIVWPAGTPPPMQLLVHGAPIPRYPHLRMGLPARRALVQRLVSTAADASFNRITVDGDMSTNDSFMLMATHQAGHARIESLESADGQALLEVADGGDASGFQGLDDADVEAMHDAYRRLGAAFPWCRARHMDRQVAGRSGAEVTKALCNGILGLSLFARSGGRIRLTAEATALQRKLSQEADDKLVADLKSKGVRVDVADKAAFETYWGVSLGANVVFLNSAGAMPLLPEKLLMVTFP